MFASIYTVIWTNTNEHFKVYYYLELTEDTNYLKPIFIDFCKWFLIMMNFVSISLLVTLEMVKFTQGYFIEKDWMIYDDEKDMPAKVQSSNLNEELGMVNYIFSDKTGTLTQNIMEFKKFSVGNQSYGVSRPKPGKYKPGVTNVNFESSMFDKHWTLPMQAGEEPKNELMQKYLYILALCHTIIIEEKDGVLVYNASSPDELALTNAARHFGIVFKDRDEDNNLIIHNEFTDELLKFEILNVIEFTSSRKRMSVIVKTPENKIMLMTKGADSVILPRLSNGQGPIIHATDGFLTEYANEGLRTLFIVEREIKKEEYVAWNRKY